MRCPASPTSPSSRPASPCAAARSDSASTRSARSGRWSTRARRTAMSDADVLDALHAAELPMAVPQVEALVDTVDEKLHVLLRAATPRSRPAAASPTCAADSAEVWSSLKMPIVHAAEIATMLGLPRERGQVHVTQGGGSFGRHLFSDAALEAVEASEAFGNKPVKLMWHRTDDFRHGRVAPDVHLARARDVPRRQRPHLRAAATRASRPTSPTGSARSSPRSRRSCRSSGNYTFAQSIFLLTANVSYNYGITDSAAQRGRRWAFHTGSMRNIYSPDVCVAQELVTDKLAAVAKQRPVRVPPQAPEEQARARRPRQGGRGRPLGTQDAGRHGAGHRGARRVQGLRRVPRRDSTAGRPR